VRRVDGMVKIILTADQTLMSEYNKNIFLGFAACAPKLLPQWLYTRIFCPPIGEEEDHRVTHGHCGQRKMESALLREGFTSDDIMVVNPNKIKKVVDEDTKVLCITTHDPLGLGPASSTFSDLAGTRPFTEYYFNKLISNPVIRNNGLKVIVGGSGAWQLIDERIIARLGIDCVVVGEGEKTGVDIIKKALNGEPIPSFVTGEVIPLEEIPPIQNPTLNGLIEICRGCGRGCRFCNPTMLNFRNIPLGQILQEAKINIAAGNGVILHAEDILRYKADGFVPNEDAVVELFTEIRKLTPRIGMSHFAHASVASKPSLIEKISDIMDAGSKQTPFLSGQVGIETGSSRLVEKYMKGKVKPFTPSEWSEVLNRSHQILAEQHWVPAETLIIGLPGETPEDTRKTIGLLDDLSQYRSLIVPLFFVPIGNLNHSGFFRGRHATPEQWKVIGKCIRHNFTWVPSIAREVFESMNMNLLKKMAIYKIINYMEKKITPYTRLMEEGENPFTPLKKENKPAVLWNKISLPAHQSTQLKHFLGK
jgi:radical SAM superfamily enzyme YgiQ (UPF0313 family)